jgi:single-stranded-DNA-specific exonuclease
VGEEVVWKFAESDPGAAENLSAALGVPSLVAHVLCNRGVRDVEEARLFLDPRLAALHDPFLLPDVDKAVDRLARAIERKEKIFLHGDYDVDGVTSAALFLRALTTLGADVTGFVPRRSDGYDLQRSGVDRAKSVGATLILTADCGSCAIEPIAYANSLGMEVVVTDHHRPGPTLPDAYALVNPYRQGWEVPFQPLCGAGVAFKVCDALVSRLMPAHREAFRHNFVDLAALGTVADVTPLIGENRNLVTPGLRALAGAKKTGLRALMLSMDMLGKPFDTESISWKIGPRLNAAGRMEDADLAYRLLITRDQDEAEQLAVQLAALAEKSREETARVTTEALVDAMSPQHEGRRVLILAREKWGKGVIGIAANRIVEAFRRPVILLSFDPDHDLYHGSARSHGDFNLHDALHQCHDLLERFGGHSASAGVSLRSAHLAAFRDRMHDLAEGFISDEVVPPTLAIDAEITHGAVLTFDLMDHLNLLAPFGCENPEPVFATRGALVLGSRRVGKDGGTCQMRLRLPNTSGEIKAVWFRNGEFAERVGVGDSVDVAYTPKINEWNGRASIELSVKDMRLTD